MGLFVAESFTHKKQGSQINPSLVHTEHVESQSEAVALGKISSKCPTSIWLHSSRPTFTSALLSAPKQKRSLGQKHLMKQLRPMEPLINHGYKLKLQLVYKIASD